jgi:hypothetical protein
VVVWDYELILFSVSDFLPSQVLVEIGMSTLHLFVFWVTVSLDLILPP